MKKLFDLMLGAFPVVIFFLHLMLIYLHKIIQLLYIPTYKSIFFVLKREFSEATRLMGHISYQLKERCFQPSLTHNPIRFNPIRVGIKSSHRCLLIHYYSINNN